MHVDSRVKKGRLRNSSFPNCAHAPKTENREHGALDQSRLEGKGKFVTLSEPAPLMSALYAR